MLYMNINKGKNINKKRNCPIVLMISKQLYYKRVIIINDMCEDMTTHTGLLQKAVWEKATGE